MTIHLPPELESSIQAAVHSGHFASVDAAMTEAASLLLERLSQTQAQATPPAATQFEAGPALKPLWEEILELTADIPCGCSVHVLARTRGAHSASRSGTSESNTYQPVERARWS